jgi:hypothetical protein
MIVCCVSIGMAFGTGGTKRHGFVLVEDILNDMRPGVPSLTLAPAPYWPWRLLSLGAGELGG